MVISVLFAGIRSLFFDSIYNCLTNEPEYQIGLLNTDSQNSGIYSNLKSPDIALFIFTGRDESEMKLFQKMNRLYPNIDKVVVHSQYTGTLFPVLIAAKVKGYISVYSQMWELHTAMTKAREGKYYFCDESLNYLIRDFTHKRRTLAK